MLRRKALASTSDNETHRKKLDLLTKGKIAGQAKLGATLTQIERNLNVFRTTVTRRNGVGWCGFFSGVGWGFPWVNPGTQR